MTRRQLLKAMGATIGFSAVPARRGPGLPNFGVPDSPGGRSLPAVSRPFTLPVAAGSPFDVKLTDIAAPAGLKSVCVSGDPDTKRWIVETTGCGIAFYDYDQDGEHRTPEE